MRVYNTNFNQILGSQRSTIPTASVPVAVLLLIARDPGDRVGSSVDAGRFLNPGDVPLGSILA